MAGGFNSIQIAGRLGADPEFQAYDTGKVRATFNVAVDRYKGKDESGEAKKSTDWFRCEAWGPKADFIGSHFRKGAGIILRGDMEQVKWTDDKGQEQQMWRINVHDAFFPPGGGGEGERREPPADANKTGGSQPKRMSAAEYQKLKAEKEKQAQQQQQQSNIDDLMSAGEIPF